MHGLVDLNCDILFQSQSIPLVIDCNDLTLESLTGSVAIFTEESAIKPPFEIHRICGFDSARVFCSKGNPFISNLNFRARDIEYYALVVAFL